mgnify:CR=1 FL=1
MEDKWGLNFKYLKEEFDIDKYRTPIFAAVFYASRLVTGLDENILDLLNELIQNHKEQSNLKRIESLEKKLINNLDENSFSELIRLKNQINGE